MKKSTILVFCIFLAAAFHSVKAKTAEDKLSGMILIQTEGKGEAWYVDPVSRQRCYLGRPSDALRIMRGLGLGIRTAELEKYQKTKFPSRLSGRIVLDVGRKGEAYYVYPQNLRGRFLGKPQDALRVMAELGLGANDKTLAGVPVNLKYPLNAKGGNPAAIGINAKETSTVAYIVDGDTVELSDGRRVRYIGIDTPERDDHFYTQAKQANSELVLNKEIIMERDISDKDKYGRLLRYVYVDGLFVNEHLVRQGYAKIFTYPPDVKYVQIFKSAQASARNSKAGMWAGRAKTENQTSGPAGDISGYACTSNIYDCADFSTHAMAQAVYEKCGGAINDIHKLDSNGDGEACETLP
jgi:endonuclease YncB( thermonuclease family)